MNDQKQITDWGQAAEKLMAGEIGVLPTDTLYGIVGSALKPVAVERIYSLRQREREKPLIVLLSSANDLALFKPSSNDRAQKVFDKVWPGPVSIIVSVPGLEWAYLHRGTESIAFRVPADRELQGLLAKVGPMVAPSANLAGESPALTIDEARRYFGSEVFYVDGGRREGAASVLVDVRNDPPRVLRPAPGFCL